MKIIVQRKMTLNKRFGANGELHHSWKEMEMRVVDSTHPRFSNGTRFDWGFAEIALKEGYQLEILP
jgi:hypothetical protein